MKNKNTISKRKIERTFYALLIIGVVVIELLCSIPYQISMEHNEIKNTNTTPHPHSLPFPCIPNDWIYNRSGTINNVVKLDNNNTYCIIYYKEDNWTKDYTSEFGKDPLHLTNNITFQDQYKIYFHNWWKNKTNLIIEVFKY